ncbi:MAG: GntR family transcriptional regulator [Victivallales bacterium]|nr:GntR family transcriptional regulator [Victivallales bacterium]
MYTLSGKKENIYKELINWMDSGRYEPGAQLPREIELVEQFGVARNTLRQVLSKLEDEGRIVRIKKRGTFVRGEKALPPLTLLIPHPYIFDSSEASGGFFRQMMNALTITCTQLGTRVETIPVTFDNKPESVNYRQLSTLNSNSRVLCYSVWAGDRLFPELDRIGCHTGVITQDTFHLRLYECYFKNWRIFNYAVRDTVAELVRSLYAEGFRRIGLISPFIDQTEHPIMNGYLQAAGELGLTALSRAVPRSLEGLPKDIFMNFCEHERPDAIIAGHGNMHKMDFRLSIQENLGISNDVKIVTTGNYELFSRFSPPIPALDYGLENICAEAAELLLADDFTPGRKDYPGSLKCGQTVFRSYINNDNFH